MASGKASKRSKGSKGSQKAPTAKGGKPVAATKPRRATDGMDAYERFMWGCLMALVFLVPIAISNANWLTALTGNNAFALPFTYDQFDIVKVFVMRFFALAALVAWVIRFFMNGGKIRRTKVDWIILIFLGWVLITSFTSISPATALFGKYRRFEGFFSFLTYAIVFFLVTQLVDRPSRIRALARVLVISGSIVALYGVMQWLGLDPINWGTKLPFEANRGFSTFGNPDLLGGFLIFPLALSITMAFSEEHMGWRAFYWFTFLISVVALITAVVRGAWIGAFIALVAVTVALILAKPKLKWVDWTAFGLTGVAGAGAVAVSLRSSNPVLNVLERFKSILAFGEGSALTRFEIWRAAWESIKARPITGFGADTFRLVFPLYKPASYTVDAGFLSVADNVHDYPLQLASGIGIPGFLLLYGLFGFALVLGLPNAFARGKGVDRLVITGLWAAAIGYIVNLVTGLSVTGSTVFLWIALAIILSPTATEQEVDLKSWMPAVGLVTAGILAACWTYNIAWFSADHYFLTGQFPQTQEQGVSDLKTAIALNPWNDQYRAQLGQTYQTQMIDAINAARQASSQNQDPGPAQAQATALFQLAETSIKETISFVPTEYDNYVFLTSLYNQAGSYFDASYLKKAIETADQGIAVEPFGPAIRFQKALAQRGQGDIKGAIATLKGTVDMDPAYADPRAVYASLLVQDGQLAEALKQYKLVAALQPTNTDYQTQIKSLEASLATAPAK